MDVEGEPFDRKLSRREMLRLAGLAAGVTVVAGPAAACGSAAKNITTTSAAKETGQLRVLDWAGYANDMPHHAMYASYLHKYPNNKPQFTFMTNESDALGKIRSGQKFDLFRPYVGWVEYFATSGLVEPWDPSLISNFKHLNPFMVKAGQYQGKQYGIPDDWGFDAILYRSDKVKPTAPSWGLIFDERYAGKVAWFDDLAMLTVAGMHLGAKDPWNQTSAELEASKNFLISKKHIARMFWASETDLWQSFGAGDLWIAYAWPNDWVQMKAKGLPVVYMHPSVGKEKPIAWVGMFMLLKGTPRPDLAHAYVDAWSSKPSAVWLENNYGYGHANIAARPSSSDLLRALQIDNPRAVGLPNAYLDRNIPQRATYARLWEEVKAA
ncbi:MAG TPA: extracellular solute-binding protein [Gaiellaceae bacterium]